MNNKILNDMSDIDSVLAEHRRHANRRLLISTLVMSGIMLASLGSLWLWSGIVWNRLAFAGLGMLVLGLLWIVSHFLIIITDCRLPDDVLQRLARLDIRDKRGLGTLQELLRTQDHLMLSQVEKFVLGEQRERELQRALEQPGAKALLG